MGTVSRSPGPARATLATMAKELSEHVGGEPWYERARAIEDASRKVLQEKKPSNTIYANVYFTAPVLADLGIPGDDSLVSSPAAALPAGADTSWSSRGRSPDPPAATFDGPAGRVQMCRSKSSANGASANAGRARDRLARRQMCTHEARRSPRPRSSTMAIRPQRAKAFVDEGAQRLHVIDLDGAFGSGDTLPRSRASATR